MKIGMKLVVVISSINLIGIGLLAGVTIIESRQEIIRLADEHARDIAIRSSERIAKWFDGYLATTRTLARIMEGYQTIPVEQRRTNLTMMLEQVLTADPGLSGVYANWSPNGLDGMDEFYANTPGTDGSGRFIPAWSWVNN
ncbi:MAG: hypothetical protein LBP19_03375, partial [Treponema sp.]|nr:hypothetical protein [Treponema sp.]